jgi:hypothetical protein
MLSIMHHYPLTEKEQEEIARLLSHTLIKKYLSNLSAMVAHDILTSAPMAAEEDKFYLRRLEHSKGQLAALETILSISNPSQSEE